MCGCVAADGMSTYTEWRTIDHRQQNIARNWKIASKRQLSRPPKRWKGSWSSISKERDKEGIPNGETRFWLLKLRRSY